MYFYRCSSILHIIQSSGGLKYIDVQSIEIEKPLDNSFKNKSTKPKAGRRSWLVKSDFKFRSKDKDANENEKDETLKSKIATLVDQTVHDTERKITSIKKLKEEHRDEEPYRAGFILSMIKKTKEVLSELFNVAVKHKDDWKALEQLKVFELIVHTNVDTTNLVRQLVELHIQHLNSTNNQNNRKRVVLL
ncbi:uncharacterized protein LOC126774251 isoform X2 [Nymphalis io]|uniref:uncharacterized protein LOC126774251 isoform X2 n=1 Tax=Inachis io TaxID=171585 RepID=UPI002167CB0B|nr:uncharacterized protein LOC126774251 isoform X2 [Nymphalis io]